MRIASSENSQITTLSNFIFGILLVSICLIRSQGSLKRNVPLSITSKFFNLNYFKAGNITLRDYFIHVNFEIAFLFAYCNREGRLNDMRKSWRASHLVMVITGLICSHLYIDTQCTFVIITVKEDKPIIGST